MIVITETDVVQACQTLFGQEINITRDFLNYMQPSGVKSAYRKKAKENHPDLFSTDSAHVQQKQTSLFRDILRAYEVLNHFFKQREESSRRGEPRIFYPRQKPRTGRTKSPHSPAAARKNEDTYYSGMIPHRTLQVGQYLYYRGKISFSALINALIWQRKQRPTIGDIALQWGWIDRDGRDKITKLCERPRLFGEKAVELGLLTIFQVNTILLYQRSHQSRLGDYFVQNNLLSAYEMERLMHDLTEHNASILSSMPRSGQKKDAYA